MQNKKSLLYIILAFGAGLLLMYLFNNYKIEKKNNTENSEISYQKSENQNQDNSYSYEKKSKKNQIFLIKIIIQVIKLMNLPMTRLL